VIVLYLCLFPDGTLTIVDIEADGNCLFRSMSDQLYYDYGANHFEIRQEICDFIEGHKDDFSVFLVLDDKDAGENDEDASDFETYVANMRQDGDWGGHLELVAASRMYRYVFFLSFLIVAEKLQ
jgi:OTU domain-containing protein 3